MKVRRKTLIDFNVKSLNIVDSAGVSALAPLQTGSFAIVLVNDQLWIGEGSCVVAFSIFF